MLSNCPDPTLPGASDPSAQNSCWRRVWTLNVPNKIKHFIWRACRESLPTKKNLLIRKVTRTAICDHCNEEVEDTIYALWVCQVLKEVWWNEHYLRNQLSTRYVDFRDLWTGIINSEVSKLAERFAYVAWSIWHKRNATRMQSSSLPFNRIYQDMCDRLQEFQAA